MTRDEAITKANVYLDEDIALLIYDNERAIASRGATDDEMESVRAHNESAMRELRERIAAVVNEMFDAVRLRDGKALN